MERKIMKIPICKSSPLEEEQKKKDGQLRWDRCNIKDNWKVDI